MTKQYTKLKERDYLKTKRELINKRLREIRKNGEDKGQYDLDIAAHNLMCLLNLYDEADCYPNNSEGEQ